jgi:hypothetical protein
MKARQKISEKLLADLAEVWEEQGKDVLTKRRWKWHPFGFH